MASSCPPAVSMATWRLLENSFTADNCFLRLCPTQPTQVLKYKYKYKYSSHSSHSSSPCTKIPLKLRARPPARKCPQPLGPVYKEALPLKPAEHPKSFSESSTEHNYDYLTSLVVRLFFFFQYLGKKRHESGERTMLPAVFQLPDSQNS